MRSFSTGIPDCSLREHRAGLAALLLISAACGPSAGSTVPQALLGTWSGTDTSGYSYDPSTGESYGISGFAKQLKFTDTSFEYSEQQQVATGSCVSGFFGDETGPVQNASGEQLTLAPQSGTLDEYVCGDHTVKQLGSDAQVMQPRTYTWAVTAADSSQPGGTSLLLTNIGTGAQESYAKDAA